jgi:hypothetical protein
MTSITVSAMTAIEVWQDQDEDNNPRDWDNLGTMVCWHRRYKLGDPYAYATPTDFLAEHSDDLMLPLYLYDHSGLSLRTSDYFFRAVDACGWDWGKVGYIHVSKDTIRHEYGVKRITATVRDRALNVLEAEVRTYDQYLQGDVWGFTLKDAEGEVIDSCGGFFGSDPRENGMADMLGAEHLDGLISAFDAFHHNH